MASSSQLRCGLTGWDHPQWDDLVYPRRVAREAHRLEYLARYCDVVEIERTFHEPLRPEIARLWLRRVEHHPHFQFVAKLPRQFSHERLLDREAVRAFHAGLQPLHAAGRLGCVVMQFPWAFRFTAENRDFLIQLRRTFHAFPLVAEFRHASWLSEEARGVLIDRRVGFVNQDLPEFSSAMPPSTVLTSSVAFVRLHGRQSRDWVHEYGDGMRAGVPYRYLYSGLELEQWRVRIERIRRFAASTFVVASNLGGGEAIVNALQMSVLLGQASEDVPTRLLERFPEELGGVLGKRPVQSALFADSRAVA